MNSSLNRYHRQILLPGIGHRGQQLISAASVLVVGAGALGSAVLMQLVPSGVGTVGIIDHDEVELSNLQRQPLYTQGDVGSPKVLAAAGRLRSMNPGVKINAMFERLSAANALDIIRDYDMVIECSDQLPVKLLVNDACVMLEKPCIIGAAQMYSGQLSVYNYRGGPTYRCLVPEPPDPLLLPTCENTGVLGMVPAVIGNMQAMEALKIITGQGKVISGQLLHFDGLEASFTELPIDMDPANKKIERLTEYGYSCPDYLLNRYIVEPGNFFDKLKNNGPFEVIALSDDMEYLSIKDYSWKTIPLHMLMEAVDTVPENMKIMLVCEHGNKNIDALKYLIIKEGCTRAYGLRYGLSALRFLGLEN